MYYIILLDYWYYGSVTDLLLITNRKLYVSFRLVSMSITSNDYGHKFPKCIAYKIDVRAVSLR